MKVTRTAKQLYSEFRRAVRKHDQQAVVSFVQGHPELHGYSGEAGTLVEILANDAPGLLEPAFEAGLSPDAESVPSCQTLLQKAASEGDLDRLQQLLRYGADPQKRNDVGELALAYACTWGQLDAVRLLVEAGAEVNAIEEHPASGYRNTPLDCANRSPEIVAYLRSNGARYLRELEG